MNVEFLYKDINNEFRFYHLVPKNIKLTENGLLSLEYMYTHNMHKEFLKSTEKYRDRICNAWGIYVDKNPSDLTEEEIIKALRQFRGKDGLNTIYFFKYPPYKKLGKRMEDLLSYKKCYSIDLNDEITKAYIKSIDWGYFHSDTRNKALTKTYYENISYSDYFKDYDDNATMLFATLNHISIVPVDGYLPLHILKSVPLI